MCEGAYKFNIILFQIRYLKTFVVLSSLINYKDFAKTEIDGVRVKGLLMQHLGKL